MTYDNSWFRQMYWYQDHITFGLSSLREYLEYSEKAIDNQLASLRKKYSELVGGLTFDKEENEYILDMYVNKFENYGLIFPQLMRKSHFMVAYSFFEGE
jgi:uncharacterized protein Usg